MEQENYAEWQTAQPFVPRSSSLLFIDGIRLTDEGAEARTTVAEEWPVVSEGFLAEMALLDIMAQSVIAANGLALQKQMTHAPVAAWALGGIKDFTITGRAKVGETLRVQIIFSGSTETVCVAQASVRNDREEPLGVAKIRIRSHQPG